MTDRQDIDALLVSALYGELDSSERARLDAHLSTHPEDRAALEAMERTRAQVRRGIEDMPTAEPPPSLSALLLQEAANAAARSTHRGARATAAEAEDQGLWARFVAWAKPIALNPAYAGAFALLLVAGTATAYYVRTGGQVAEPELRRADRGVDTTIAEPTAPPPPEEGAMAGAPVKQEAADVESYRVDLDGVAAADGDSKADKALERAKDAGGKGGAPKVARATGARREDRAAPGYIEVEKKPAAIDIKEAPADPSDEELKLALEDDAVARDGRSRKTASPTMGGAAATTGAGAAAQPEPSRAEPALEQWAQTSHARLKQLVADRKCPEAGRLGAEIKDRAPEYYAANVANDRAIRACKSYIEGQAKKKAAKDYKSRAQTNTVDQSEAPAPADSK
jgi:anti-sigma factor RsiW